VGRPFVVQTALMNQYAGQGTLFRPDDAILALQRRATPAASSACRPGPFVGAQSPYGQNDLAVHGLEQLAGHHGNEMGRYRNLIGGEHALNLATRSCGWPM
jgi:hypothetical protein